MLFTSDTSWQPGWATRTIRIGSKHCPLTAGFVAHRVIVRCPLGTQRIRLSFSSSHSVHISKSELSTSKFVVNCINIIPEVSLYPSNNQKTIKDQKGLDSTSLRLATVMAHPERVKQWSVRPIVIAVMVVVVLAVWLWRIKRKENGSETKLNSYPLSREERKEGERGSCNRWKE